MITLNKKNEIYFTFMYRRELRTTDAPSEVWKKEDQATVKRYVETYGKARDFVDDDDEDALLKAEGKPMNAKYLEEEHSDEENAIVSINDAKRAQKKKDREDEKASKRADEMALLRKRLDESAILVIPGNIVHFYRDNGLKLRIYEEVSSFNKCINRNFGGVSL